MTANRTEYSFDTDIALQFWGARSFNIADIGGGCEAFRLDYTDGRYILITRADDPEAPETTDEAVNVSLYAADDHNETADSFTADDSEEAAAILDELRQRDAQWNGEVA